TRPSLAVASAAASGGTAAELAKGALDAGAIHLALALERALVVVAGARAIAALLHHVAVERGRRREGRALREDAVEIAGREHVAVEPDGEPRRRDERDRVARVEVGR